MAINPHTMPAHDPVPYSVDMYFVSVPDLTPMAVAPEAVLAAAAIALLTPLATRSAKTLGGKMKAESAPAR